MKTLLLAAFVALIFLAEARFPKTLQPQWSFLDSDEFSKWTNSAGLEARVIGGSDAKSGEAKFQISLLRKSILGSYSHTCGGSLISKRTVVTAAHCTYGSSASSMAIRYGTDKRSESQYPIMKIAQIKQHENYNPETIENDISLLILASEVQPSSNVAFIAIDENDAQPNEQVKVYGWGRISGSSNALPEKLQVGTMSIVDQKTCNAKWGAINAIKPGMICALDKTQSACNGDSGGPLVSAKGQLTGIVSWGPNNCPPGNYMSVFTRPSYYKTWIVKNMI